MDRERAPKHDKDRTSTATTQYASSEELQKLALFILLAPATRTSPSTSSSLSTKSPHSLAAIVDVTSYALSTPLRSCALLIVVTIMVYSSANSAIYRLRAALTVLLLISCRASADAFVSTSTDVSRELTNSIAAVPPTPVDSLAGQTPSRGVQHDKADKSAGKMSLFVSVVSPETKVAAEAMGNSLHAVGDTAGNAAGDTAGIAAQLVAVPPAPPAVPVAVVVKKFTPSPFLARQIAGEAISEGVDTATTTDVAPPVESAQTADAAPPPTELAAAIEDAGTVAPYFDDTTQASPDTATVPSSSTDTVPSTGSGSSATTSTTSPTASSTSKSASGSSGGNQSYACTCKELRRVSLMGYADYCLPEAVDIGKKCGNRNEATNGACPKRGAQPCSSTGYELTQDAECLLDNNVYKCVLSADDYDIKKNGGKPKKPKKTAAASTESRSSQETSVKSDAAIVSTVHVGTLVAAVVLSVVAALL